MFSILKKKKIFYIAKIQPSFSTLPKKKKLKREIFLVGICLHHLIYDASNIQKRVLDLLRLFKKIIKTN